MLRAIPNIRSQKKYNVLVVGAGIVGSSVAYACARRGWSVLAIDKRDVAAATSASSTGLLHGGARYAKSLQFGMVYNAIRGREAFKKAAPHLVREVQYCVPALSGGSNGYWEMRIGRWLYDSTKLMGLSSFPAGKTLNAKRLEATGFPLSTKDLKGASFFWDGQTDDHRLALTILMTAAQHNADVASRIALEDFLYSEQGKIIGAQLKDTTDGKKYEIFADAVVNATGPWVDDLVRLQEPKAPSNLVLDAGSHLIVRNFFPAPLAHGFFMEFKDGRLVFILPHGKNLLIGTTSEGEQASKYPLFPSGHYVRYLLDGINQFFPQANLTLEDVIIGYSGHRPLFCQPGANSADAISRKHEIKVSKRGLINIYGGKITPALLIGEETAQKIAKTLGFCFEPQPLEAPLVGGNIVDFNRFLKEESARLASAYGIGHKTAEYLIFKYGTTTEEVLALSRGEPNLLRPLAGGHPALEAQVVHAAKKEMALTITDVLLRRIRLDRVQGNGFRALPRTAELMQSFFGLSLDETMAQINVYTDRVIKGLPIHG